MDGNQDGRLDENDWIWGQLLIWRDLDSDGMSDDGELQTLAQAGVASISLAAQQASWWQAGNEVRLESTFVNQAGQISAVADVWFAVVPEGAQSADSSNVGLQDTSGLTDDVLKMRYVFDRDHG